MFMYGFIIGMNHVFGSMITASCRMCKTIRSKL